MRTTLVVLAGLSLAAAVALTPRRPHPEPTESARLPPAPPATLPSVMVQHDLVEVVPMRAAARVPAAPLPPHASPARAHAPASRGLLARTGRALVGDGRYRPEPFPRPGR